MNYEIDHFNICKLEHDIIEIRVRALQQIDKKISGALFQNKDIQINFSFLIKNLIGWFYKKPLCKENCVMDLILKILESKYIEEVVQNYGISKLINDFKKLFQIQSLYGYRIQIEQILELLGNYRTFIGRDPSFNSENTIAAKDLEQAWSVPTAADYNSLKQIHIKLSTNSEEHELLYALQFLRRAVDDYPTEYFLQPPYLYKTLLSLCMEKHLNTHQLLHVLICLVRAMFGRAKIHGLTESTCAEIPKENKSQVVNQITLSRFTNDLLEFAVQQLKYPPSTISQENFISSCYLTIQVLDIIKHFPIEISFINTVLINLSYTAKKCRHSLQNKCISAKFDRIHYIIILDIISRLVQIIQEMESLNNHNSKHLNGSENTLTENELLQRELETALYDYPLKIFFPKNYQLIKDLLQRTQEKSVWERINAVLECETLFASTSKLLQHADEFSNEELLAYAVGALETISIHNNTTFITKIMQAATRIACMPSDDSKRKVQAKNLFLRLFSHEDLQIKRMELQRVWFIQRFKSRDIHAKFISLVQLSAFPKLVYQYATNSIKHFFSCVIDGHFEKNKMHSSNFLEHFLGIPLTGDLLTEIICFGNSSSDELIRTEADTILCLILKSQKLLGQFWGDILQILLPVFPLLQCLATESTTLGRLILDLFHPDFNISLEEVFKGNLRFLFSPDSLVRSKALARIIYILSSNNSELHTPDIVKIADKIPSDIFLLKVPRDHRKIFCSGLYESSTVHPLLDVLRCSDIDPSIRKSALLQVNIICQDPDVCKLVCDENGWYFAVKALQNFLQVESCMHWADAVIPAVGIITKMILGNSRFRTEISKELNIYFLLIKAALIYYHDISLLQDCALALFLLLYSSYIVGNNNITIPFLCSTFHIPLKCNYHWKSSPHHSKSYLEKIFERIDDSSVESSLKEEIVNSNTIKKECIKQFIRISFAAAWFHGFENLFEIVRTASVEGKELILDYSNFPSEKYPGHLQKNHFNLKQSLPMTESDIKMVMYTSPHYNITHFLKNISNSTSYSDIIIALEGLKLSLLAVSNTNEYSTHILKCLEKFFVTIPGNDMEILLFEKITQLLSTLIESGDTNVIDHIWLNIQKPDNIFTVLLNNKTCPISLFETNCKFIKLLVRKSADLNRSLIMKNNISKTLGKFFQGLFFTIEESFNSYDMVRLSSLISLSQTVSSIKSCEIDLTFMKTVTTILLLVIKTLKSFSYAGSNLNKNCILVIGNILEICSLDQKQIKLLSGLCGHQDYEIRCLCWCILGKISKSVEGAQMLVKGLSHLPGGLFSCCLSTLFDESEVSIVRSAAGYVASDILSYKGKIDLQKAGIENDGNSESLQIGIIFKEFETHRVFNRIKDSLDVCRIRFLEKNKTGITCSLVRAYCSIITTFLDLKKNLFESFDEQILSRMLRVIKDMSPCITPMYLRMVADICKMLIRFLNPDLKYLRILAFQHIDVVAVLVHLLDINFYGNDLDILTDVLHFLRLIATEECAFTRICQELSTINLIKLVRLIQCGISNFEFEGFHFASLEFFSSLLLMSQHADHDSFIELMNGSIITSDGQIELSTNCDRNRSVPCVTGLELLFLEVEYLFKRSFDKTVICCTRYKVLICEILATVLKVSSDVRIFAEKVNFLTVLLETLCNLYDGLEMTCTEFIRKFGETKKEIITHDMILIYGIILNWNSEVVITEKILVEKLSQITIKLWGWTNHSKDLQKNVLTTLAILSEYSSPACREFSSKKHTSSFSILELVLKLIFAESALSRQSEVNITVLTHGLRILSNCCSCVEGRLQLLKILEHFNNLYSVIAKSNKMYTPLILWLQFWEIFSRYPEGCSTRHLYFIGNLIAKGKSSVRCSSLVILRNLAFVNTNRSAILLSDDFMYITNLLLDGNNSQEQFQIVVIIWRLIAGNYKGKYAINNTSIPVKLKNILSQIHTKRAIDDNNLLSILEIVIKILDTKID